MLPSPRRFSFASPGRLLLMKHKHWLLSVCRYQLCKWKLLYWHLASFSQLMNVHHLGRVVATFTVSIIKVCMENLSLVCTAFQQACLYMHTCKHHFVISCIIGFIHSMAPSQRLYVKGWQRHTIQYRLISQNVVNL